MTELSDLEEIDRKAKEALERLANIVPSRPFSPDEVTKLLIHLQRNAIALQVQCEALKAMIDELKTHHHVTGDMIYGLADQRAPGEPATDSSAGD